MATKNDITGDSISSRGTSNNYRDNYDAIFRKKKVDTNSDFWYHKCKHNGDTHTEKGSHCNWCGINEEGKLD